MRKATTRLFFHILVVTLVLVMPIVDAPSPKPTALLMLKNPFVEIDFVLHALCIVFGYFNYFVLIPSLFHRHSKLIYFLTVAVLFVFMCFVPEVLSKIPFAPFFEDQDALNIHTIIQIRHIFFLFMVIFLFSFMTWSEAKRRQAEREKSLAETRYLKAQINPHFLFNTLNSIYALIHVNPAEAGRSLIKMSNIMRHTLQASETSFESLTVCLESLDDFVSLQKERFGNTVQLDYKVSINRDDLKIAPLILIPFVENAFKYGIDPEFSSAIIIKIWNEGSQLFTFISNSDFHDRQNLEDSTGIGMANTQNRLNLIYPGKHTLDIVRKDRMFMVSLILELE